MKVNVERLLELYEEIQKINRCDLKDIEFYEKGKKLDIPQEFIDKFWFTGLTNVHFITAGLYKTRFTDVTEEG